MKQIIKDIYHVGDNECSVYMVDTQSDQGLVLIDADILCVISAQRLKDTFWNFSAWQSGPKFH